MDQLRRLDKEGIIESVEFADWAAPIVPVLKGNRERAYKSVAISSYHLTRHQEWTLTDSHKLKTCMPARQVVRYSQNFI